MILQLKLQLFICIYYEFNCCDKLTVSHKAREVRIACIFHTTGFGRTK